MGELVRSERSGDTVTVTLCNPAKRNALSIGVLRELINALGAAGESDATGIVLAAEGPVFSAGHNFGEMRGASYADAHELFTVCSTLMQMMHTLPQPVVAR
ncbi:MAG: enoyl-CoA hydratase-related protein, partial [Acidimicrobiales bacterium]